MTKLTLYSASGGEGKDPFGLFSTVKTINNPEDIKPGGVLLLWGGEDIGTSLYGQKPNKMCLAEKPSSRDKRELLLINAALINDVPIIGICRGAQLLCAAAGGSLAQHIDNHGRTHDVQLHDEFDVVIQCNSSHHQMMIPPKSAKILASSPSTTGIDEDNQAITYDRVNEVVYFPALNALGIQPHPEWLNCPKPFVDYCVRKIKEYLL